MSDLTGTVVAAVALGLLVGGCSQQSYEKSDRPGSNPTLTEGKSIELTRFSKQEPLGFRRADATLLAKGSTHRLTVGMDGTQLQIATAPSEFDPKHCEQRHDLFGHDDHRQRQRNPQRQWAHPRCQRQRRH